MTRWSAIGPRSALVALLLGGCAGNLSDEQHPERDGSRSDRTVAVGDRRADGGAAGPAGTDSQVPARPEPSPAPEPPAPSPPPAPAPSPPPAPTSPDWAISCMNPYSEALNVAHHAQ